MSTGRRYRYYDLLLAGFVAVLLCSNLIGPRQSCGDVHAAARRQFGVRCRQPVFFGNTWRVVAASVLGFWAGDFVNAYVMAKMKIATRGRWLDTDTDFWPFTLRD